MSAFLMIFFKYKVIKTHSFTYFQASCNMEFTI